MRSGFPDHDLEPDHVPGLEQLPTKTAKRILDAGRVVRIPEGWVPIRPDEPSDEAYLIVEGCMEVRDGETTVADVCRGEFVGEMGLVTHSLRSAQVTATEPVVAVAWPREKFQALRTENKEFDRLVSDVAEDRSRRNQHRSAD